MPNLGEMGQYAQSELYAAIMSGLGGTGILPPVVADRNYEEQLAALRNAKALATEELRSNLNRFVPAADTKVRNYANTALSRDYANTVYGLKEAESLRKIMDKQTAVSMAFDALAAEKRMAASITDMYNRNNMMMMQDEMNFGTRGGNIAGGLASGLGYYLGSGHKLADLPTNFGRLWTNLSDFGGGFGS